MTAALIVSKETGYSINKSQVIVLTHVLHYLIKQRYAEYCTKVIGQPSLGRLNFLCFVEGAVQMYILLKHWPLASYTDYLFQWQLVMSETSKRTLPNKNGSLYHLLGCLVRLPYISAWNEPTHHCNKPRILFCWKVQVATDNYPCSSIEGKASESKYSCFLPSELLRPLLMLLRRHRVAVNPKQCQAVETDLAACPKR